jgi:hypothetical protein
MSEDREEAKRIFCNLCKGETHHSLRARHRRARKLAVDDDGIPLDDVLCVGNSADYKLIDFGEVTTSIWSCNGCDEETFEFQYIEADPAGARGHTYYPERLPELSADSIHKKKRFQKLDPKLNRLYDEVITCFNGGCPLLCSFGLRALIEGVCGDKGLKDGPLWRRIDGLVEFIPSQNLIDHLHSFKEFGNKAAHELEALTREEAEAAIVVMEDLLNFLYDLDYKASQMKYSSKRAEFRSLKPGPVH